MSKALSIGDKIIKNIDKIPRAGKFGDALGIMGAIFGVHPLLSFTTISALTLPRSSTQIRQPSLHQQ
jgi:hypothetical protein